ncbi:MULTISPECIES: helix-turn-helix domain-containing protein [Paenibacillus]|uniref:helix-turn-helix domain-containing protein n=1 Tax=Paenibacillus TaxID=44249 RepID=UPI00096EE791|nr:AraC family transcriptional regulator [Paenibacillus odorifer]OMD17270.1 hypothetical protein BJP50_16090 [Paenibacillus odorifer]
MKVKTIMKGIILFPGEFEKWTTLKNDFIYIKSEGKIDFFFNRYHTEILENMSGLFQCCYGSFTIQNVSKSPVYLQGIKFSCETKLHKDFFATVFDESPFQSIIVNDQSCEKNSAHIIKILENFQKPPHFQKNVYQIDPRLIQVNRFIRKNYDSKISLQNLADLAEVHPTYLSNTYSKVFKTSPIYFVNQLRMKKAKELLKQPDLTIKEIALIIGYNSLPQFSLIFKRFYSKSPTQYREEILKKT